VILCLCEGVSQRAIETAVRDGATTVRAVSRCTGAGTGCGSCACDVRAIVRRARQESASDTSNRAK
jgi:bacterioferritin-associated ferredoxin